MREIPEEIRAALIDRNHTPSVKLTLRDATDRPLPDRATANEHAGRSALLRFAGGYLRAYVNQPGLDSDAQVYSQLVTDVDDPDQWDTYALRKTGAEGQAGVSVVQLGDTAYLFYERLSDHTICYQTTTDGAGWSAEQDASVAGDHAWAIAAATDGDSGLNLFAAVNATLGDDSTQDVHASSFDGSSWTDDAPWTLPSVQIRGGGAQEQPDAGQWTIVLGAQTRAIAGLCLRAITYDGSSWTAAATARPIENPDTGLSCPFPSLTTTADGTLLCAATIYDDGTASGAEGQHTELWRSADGTHWTLEAQLHASPLINGASIAPGPEAGYRLADAGTTLPSAAAAGTLNPELDLTPRLSSMSIDDPASAPANATLLLENDDGAIDPPTPAADGPTGALRTGAQLLVELGYAGVTVLTHTLYIDEMHNEYSHDAEPHRRLTIHASNRARALRRQPPTTTRLTERNVRFLTRNVALSGGLPAASIPQTTDQFAHTVADWSTSPETDAAARSDSFAARHTTTGTTPPPGSWLAHLHRLAGLYGFEWFVDEADTLQVHEPLTDDATAWPYTAPDDPATEHTAGATRQPTAALVTAPTAPDTTTPTALATNEAEAANQGETATSTTHDRLLATNGQAQTKADLTLRRHDRARRAGTATVPLNPGLQPLDVIEIADEAQATTRMRITQLTWRFDEHTNTAEQWLTLEAP